jgi:hypothetical protein
MEDESKKFVLYAALISCLVFAVLVYRHLNGYNDVYVSKLDSALLGNVNEVLSAAVTSGFAQGLAEPDYSVTSPGKWINKKVFFTGQIVSKAQTHNVCVVLPKVPDQGNFIEYNITQAVVPTLAMPVSRITFYDPNVAWTSGVNASVQTIQNVNIANGTIPTADLKFNMYYSHIKFVSLVNSNGDLQWVAFGGISAMAL